MIEIHDVFKVLKRRHMFGTNVLRLRLDLNTIIVEKRELKERKATAGAVGR